MDLAWMTQIRTRIRVRQRIVKTPAWLLTGHVKSSKANVCSIFLKLGEKLILPSNIKTISFEKFICEKTWFQSRWYWKSLLLEKNQRICLLKLSKLDCPLPGRKSSIYVNMLVYQLFMLSDISRCSFVICRFLYQLLLKIYFIRVHVNIRHYFKQFENLSKFWAWSESRLFANGFSGVTTKGDSWSKRPTISKQTTGILSGRTRCVGGHDAWKYTLHMKNVKLQIHGR